VVRPLRSVTDLVSIRYNPKNPQDLIEAWSVRSYAFGSFFFVIGLMIAATQAVILRNARRPIVIDPLEALGGR
jgi:hypothetical protein